MSITLSATLPKGYEPRTMYLYIGKTRRRWGFLFSDGKGYSVPALLSNGHDTALPMLDFFSTRKAAAAFAVGQGWSHWPNNVTRGVPKMLDAKGRGTAAHRSCVTALYVEGRR